MKFIEELAAEVSSFCMDNEYDQKMECKMYYTYAWINEILFYKT